MPRNALPAIALFQRDMELKLEIHSDKGEWSQASYADLFYHLKLEIDELEHALKYESPEAAQRECADIGNLAMMIHDNLGGEKDGLLFDRLDGTERTDISGSICSER